MPSVVLGGPKKNSILNRSESLRSEVSDASLASKKVSFNNDVRIRRIPGGIVHGQVVAVLDPSGQGQSKGQESTGGCLWINSDLHRKSETVEQDLLAEAATVLNSVDKIQCRSSPTPEPVTRFKTLERSKSEILPTSLIGRRGGGSGKKDQLLGGNINYSKYLDVELPSSNPENLYSKASRIKKPTRRRAGLNSIGESSSASSGHDSEGFHQHFSSESPLSSISSGDMATTHQQQQRFGRNPPAQVSNLSSSIRREHAGPPLRSSYLEASHGNTHNNNQPFSYTSRNSPETHGKVNGHVKSPREIIYAQVVSGEKKDGTPEKRTIHKKYSDITTTPSEASPTDYPKHIRHFVYDKENWKNLNSSHENSHSLLSSPYKGRLGSQYGSKNNVTTVLLNSNDEEDSLRSTTIHNNDLFNHKNSRSSSSPPQLAGRPFFYGDTRQVRTTTFDHSSSSSPQSQFQYSSSSREQSPAGLSAAKLIRDGEYRKSTTVVPINGPMTPTKVVTTTYGSSAKNHTDYNYMNSKLGYLTPSEYSMDVTRLPPRPVSLDRKQQVSKSTGRYEQIKTTGNGWRTKETEYNNGKKNLISNGYTTANNRPAPTYATLDKNKKNSQSTEKKETMGQKSLISSSSTTNGSSGGLISTLMRRNRDKKVIKEKTVVPPPSSNRNPPLDGKVKPRNKFLSLFLHSSKTGTKSNDNSKLRSPPNNNHSRGSSKSKLIVTDSEIDDAERKRDGEYHSWSSVDGSYRLENIKMDQQRPKERLARGKSYNFGDYRQNEDRWYKERENDSEDYRRDLARTQTTVHHKSATLGRPIMRSSNDGEELRASRTKSLDRRNLRPNHRYDPPPQIIVTPNSPPVDESGYNWEPSYHQTTKAKLDHKLSKSSIELDSYGRSSGVYRSDHHRNQNVRRDPSPNRLRYFGDTDGESVANQRRTLGQQSRFDSPSRIPNGKMDQGYQSQNGNHISRRDTGLRKGRNDGINSSEESESRFSKSSSRSVFLHAPTVAEIPPPTGLQRRTLSKDEISNYSGPQKQAVHLERSMSVLAPWRPRNYREKYEVRYDSEGHKDNKYRRPPKPPRSPNHKSNSPNSIKRRSESSEHLLLPEKPSGKEGGGRQASTLGRFAGTLKRSKSTAAESSFGNGSWFPRRKEN